MRIIRKINIEIAYKSESWLVQFFVLQSLNRCVCIDVCVYAYGACYYYGLVRQVSRFIIVSVSVYCVPYMPSLILDSHSHIVVFVFSITGFKGEGKQPYKTPETAGPRAGIQQASRSSLGSRC